MRGVGVLKLLDQKPLTLTHSRRERGLTVRDLKNVTGQLEGEGWGEGLLKNAGKKKPRQMAGLRYERGARKTVRYPGLQ